MRDVDEVHQRIVFAHSERARAIAAGVVGAAFLAGLGAVVATILGAAIGFDATPVAAVLGIAAAVLLIALTMGFEGWTVGQLARVASGEPVDLDGVGPTPVPEAEEMELSRRRAMLRRIEAQRAARNQRAASGGSVSSAEAGRPSHGSSEATTEP